MAVQFVEYTSIYFFCIKKVEFLDTINWICFKYIYTYISHIMIKENIYETYILS